MSDIALKAAELARSSPLAWGEFLTALKSYSDEQRDNLVSSPIEKLQTMQGRAQGCAQLLHTLEQSLKIADQIEKRKPK